MNTSLLQILCSFLFLSFCNSILAQCKKGDCIDGYGVQKIVGTQDIYKGMFKDGKRHGSGIYTWSNGSKYEGDWYNGMKWGQGILFETNGDKYDGNWIKNSFEGKGTYYEAGGDKYVGEWQKDKFHGQGIYYYSDGSRYNGNWEYGKKDGYGIYSFSDGNRYEGEFAYGVMEGCGMYFWGASSDNSGHKYVGEFKRGKMSGIGTRYFTNSENGQRFVGEFKNNKFHGYGLVYDENGKVETSAKWEGGKEISTISLSTVEPFTKSNCNGGEGSTIHFIVFSATNDRSLSSSAAMTNDYFSKNIIPQLESSSGMKVQHYINKGDKFNKYELERVIDNLNTQEDDAIFFYYVGHGYNEGRSDFPTLTLGIEGSPLHKRKKSLDAVYDKLKSKPHRLLITVAEACNGERAGFPISSNPITLDAPPQEDDESEIKRLFKKATGNYLVSSSSKGQASYLISGQPGQFTIAFREAFSTVVSKDYGSNATWGDIWNKTKLNLMKLTADCPSCGEQTAQIQSEN